jgi:hypothetical protein
MTLVKSDFRSGNNVSAMLQKCQVFRGAWLKAVSDTRAPRRNEIYTALVGAIILLFTKGHIPLGSKVAQSTLGRDSWGGIAIDASERRMPCIQNSLSNPHQVKYYGSYGSLRTPKEKRSRVKRFLFSTGSRVLSDVRPEHEAKRPN